MMRRFVPVLLAALLLTSSAFGQTAWRFRWQPNQTLVYRVEQTTGVEEVVGDKKTAVNTKLTLVKRWLVQAVDAQGTATLQLSLASMRNEIARSNGEPLVYDSADAEKSAPELRDQLAKYIGVPLALIRVDARGQVVEVKESKHGPASRYESDPPFKVVFPEAAGESWTRSYQVTLEPPAGTGEKYDATQQLRATAGDGTLAVSLTTTIAKLPENLLDQVPLLQYQPAGEVVFDTRLGMMKSAKIRIEKELKEHQGAGSSYRFVSTYTEEYTGDK